MSLIKFRKIILEQGQTVENWLGENDPDENTRYTFFDNEGGIVGEYIGDEPVITGASLNRVRIFNEQNELMTVQMIHEGESLKEENKLKNGYLFEYGTRNEFDFNTIITEDIDLTYSVIPPRYVQTTVEDFASHGDYVGTEEYIILPEDKPSGYRIQNLNVKGVATNGDYLTDASNMFVGNNSLSLELDFLNTSNVTDMSNMFLYSQALELDLSNFDTSNVTNMSEMFYSSNATTLDLSSFDTSNVTDMTGIFILSKATTIDASSFDTSNITDMSNMFYNSQATTIDVSNFNTSNVTNMEGMFYNSQATTLDLSSFDTSNVTNMESMFYNSQATIGYARTQEDADNLNSNPGKPSALNFEVKEDDQVFSGNYNDLTNKPTKLSDFDNDEDFATNTYVDTEINTKLNNTIEEAPQDGKLYARKDGTWVEIELGQAPEEPEEPETP